MDASLLAAFLAAVVFLGLRAARQRSAGSEDYILAGRSLTLPTFIATLVTSFYGGTLGIGESAWRYGLSNWLMQGAPYYLFALLYAVFLVGRVRARPGLTIPDHIELAYGRPTAVLGAALVFLLASPADEMLMLGTLLHWIIPLPLSACILGVAGLTVLFLFRGGMRAQAWTGLLEFAVMFGGFSLILPAAWLAVGGLSMLRTAVPATHLSLTGGHSPLYLLSWFFIALWTFVDPAFHQRVCAAKDARTARRGIAVSVLFWFAFDFMTTTTGLCARALIPDIEDPLSAYPALAERLLPAALRGLFLAGVAASTLASLSTTSFLSAVSLAKDCLGRLYGLAAQDEERWIRRGLIVSSALGAALALAVPSVVGLWFLVGSTTIPGLLVALVSSYFELLRVPPAAAFASILSGWLAALGSWAWGYPFPFYPGLGCSLAVWGLGRAVRALRERALP